MTARLVSVVRGVYLHNTLVVALMIALFGHVPASAQGDLLAEGVPILGTISAQSPGAFFTLQADPGTLVTLQVVGLTSGMNPNLTLFSPTQDLVAEGASDPLGLGGDARLSYQIEDADVHFVLVGGSNGDFVLRYSAISLAAGLLVEPGTPATQPLETGRLLTFTIPADPLLSTSISVQPQGSEDLRISANIYASSGEIVAVVVAQGNAPGTALVAPAEGSYIVTVSMLAGSGEVVVNASRVELDTPAPIEPTLAPSATEAASVCQATPSGTVGVNVRAEPRTTGTILTVLQPGEQLVITARDLLGAWFGGALPDGGFGWVFGGIVTLTGQCTQLAVVSITGATLTPSATTTLATTTMTLTPSLTLSPSATASGTVTMASPTFTYTPSATTTLAPPPPTLTSTATSTATTAITATASPTATASFTATVPVPTAPPDANFNSPLNIPLDSTASVTDFVSFPDGDREDRVRWDIAGMNSVSSLSGGRARLILAVSCFGTGTNQIQFTTGGQTFACGQTIVDREVTFDSRTGQVTITAIGGTNTYVQWVLTGTATRVN